jgi:hypothetical protein
MADFLRFAKHIVPNLLREIVLREIRDGMRHHKTWCPQSRRSKSMDEYAFQNKRFFWRLVSQVIQESLTIGLKYSPTCPGQD